MVVFWTRGIIIKIREKIQKSKGSKTRRDRKTERETKLRTEVG